MKKEVSCSLTNLFLELSYFAFQCLYDSLIYLRIHSSNCIEYNAYGVNITYSDSIK